MTARAWSVEYS